MSKRLVLFKQSGEKSVITNGLTKQQAHDICSIPQTQGKDWFIGFEEEDE